MKLNFKKSLKIMTLLISALIISTASAAIYYSLKVSSTATVTTSPTVKLVIGADLPGATVSGVSATLPIQALPNVELTYDQALVVDNTAGGTPSIKLTHVSVSSDHDDSFEYIYITLVDDSSTPRGYIHYTVVSGELTADVSSSYVQMDANDNWSIKIQTKAASGATVGHTATIAITVDVQA
jgi:hypothetical protein